LSCTGPGDAPKIASTDNVRAAFEIDSRAQVIEGKQQHREPFLDFMIGRVELI